MWSEMLLVCCGLATVFGQAAEQDRLLVFVARDGTSASVHVDCARRAKQPVSPLLYGKFAEHLGRNIYHGMWAQLVRNPGFEPSDLWGRRAEGTGDFLARRFQMPELASWVKRGLPLGWAAFGNGKIDYAADPNAFNSRQCLRMQITSTEGSPAGVRQPLDLPIHRQLAYEWSLHIQAERAVDLTIQLMCRADPKLAAKTVVRVKPGTWQQLSGRLRLPKRDLPPETHFVLRIGFGGPGTIRLDQCLLFPADHLDGWDPDVVRLVKESELPILRWPGGNFASGYHWKDGIGPLRKRPTRFNRPWNMPEPNHVGTDEFMRFCELAGCEPMICVNAGDGSPEEAADWVEYCNGPVTTPLGKLRSANGHPEPYGVRYWEIGNELYGSWQIGHCTADEYAERYRKFFNAMRKRDPNIRFIANGQSLEWNRPLVERCADILRGVSVHTLIGGGMPTTTPPEKVWWSVMGYPWEYRHHLHALSRQLRRHVPHGKLAITELQIFTNRANLPNNAGLAEALFWTGIVNTAIRAGDQVEMITHSALVNHGGGLRKRREVVYPNPVYLARKLYTVQPGRWPVPVQVEGPAFSADRLHNLSAVRHAPILDVMALASDDGDKLVLLVTNRHARDPVPAEFTLAKFNPAGEAAWQWITGEDILAANSLETPNAVKLQRRTLPVPGSRFQVIFPARSISAVTLSKKGSP